MNQIAIKSGNIRRRKFGIQFGQKLLKHHFLLVGWLASSLVLLHQFGNLFAYFNNLCIRCIDVAEYILQLDQSILGNTFLVHVGAGKLLRQISLIALNSPIDFSHDLSGPTLANPRSILINLILALRKPSLNEIQFFQCFIKLLGTQEVTKDFLILNRAVTVGDLIVEQLSNRFDWNRTCSNTHRQRRLGSVGFERTQLNVFRSNLCDTLHEILWTMLRVDSDYPVSKFVEPKCPDLASGIGAFVPDCILPN